jgi:hypothetical protein
VTVFLPGYLPTPEQVEVAIADGDTAAAEFALELIDVPKTVLLEEISNVACIGCPLMAARLHALMTTPGYGPDNVVLIMYAANWPFPADPHYLANIPDNDARYAYYGFTSLPVLYVEGERLGVAGSVPDAAEIRDAVDAELAEDVTFRIDVTADLTDYTVPVQVVLTAVESTDLTGHVLRVALVEEEIVYDPQPDGWTDDVFHWVMRDVAVATDDVGVIGPGATTYQAEVVRQDGFDLAMLHVIAFVQNDGDKSVVQAGSNIPVTARARAERGSESSPRAIAPSPGGTTR